MNCPRCDEELDSTMVTVDLGGGWVTIMIECDNCGTILSADVESHNLTEEC